MSHFAQRYEAKLAELTFNSKPIINGLTIIADENKNVHAQDVVNCITARIGQVRICKFIFSHVLVVPAH